MSLQPTELPVPPPGTRVNIEDSKWKNPFRDIEHTKKMYLAYLRASGLDLTELEGKDLIGAHAKMLGAEVLRKQKLRTRVKRGPEEIVLKKVKPRVIANCPTPDIPENLNTIYIDETGVGAYAGAMYITAVFLLPGFNIGCVTDSKKYKGKEDLRSEVAELLKTSEHVMYKTVIVSVESIDKYNVWGAWDRAVVMAAEGLAEQVRAAGHKAERLVIDGTRQVDCPSLEVFTCKGGDAKYSGIAAASVIAKTDRDNYMRDLAEYVNPMWKDIFIKGHGYAYKAAEHKALILAGEATKYHRKSYNPYKGYLSTLRKAEVEPALMAAGF